MKKDCEFFLNEPIILELYQTDLGMDEEDLNADRDEVRFFIEKLDKRIASLSKWKSKQSNNEVNPPKGKRGKRRCKKSEPKETACEESTPEANDCGPYTSDGSNPSVASPQ